MTLPGIDPGKAKGLISINDPPRPARHADAMATIPAVLAVTTAVWGLALPQGPTPARTIAMTLCSGGLVTVDLDDKGPPAENQGSCHGVIMAKREKRKAAEPSLTHD